MNLEAIHRKLCVWTAAAVCLAGMVSVAPAAETECAKPSLTDVKPGHQVWKYQPNQICPPIPKFDYTDKGRAIMIKRYPYYTARDFNHMLKFRYMENKQGVEHIAKGLKLKREPDEVLSEQQKEILREWGQPDYLRGPYKSTQGDKVVEWLYHPMNHIFQFVDRTMVYEGPLTDQERTGLVHGAPSEVLVSQQEPNIRRETWIYRPIFSQLREEKIYSFSNGKLVYSQEKP